MIPEPWKRKPRLCRGFLTKGLRRFPGIATWARGGESGEEMAGVRGHGSGLAPLSHAKRDSSPPRGEPRGTPQSRREAARQLPLQGSQEWEREGMGIQLQFQTEGNVKGELEAELKALISGKIAPIMNDAMRSVGFTMQDKLKEHIEDDVYKRYSPKVYPRRSGGGGIGIPLNSLQNMKLSGTAFTEAGGSVSLRYSPDGSNAATTADLKPGSPYYNADNPQPIKPNPVHGDDLIRRIETGRGYDWKLSGGQKFPARPFWKRFVEEMIEGGGFENALFWALSESEFEIELDDGVEREAGDGDY